MRQIVVDTETTGLDFEEGHRIIEVACIELNDRKLTRNEFHEYLNPQRAIDHDALKIHGIDNKFLESKPTFSEISQSLFEFIEGAELIIHNADFDLKFLNCEFGLAAGEFAQIESVCSIIDTLEMARRLRPGRRNSLDALASQFEVELASERTLHSALLDAKILAGVYLALTAEQTSFEFTDVSPYETGLPSAAGDSPGVQSFEIIVQQASEEELALHEQWLDYLDEQSAKGSVWRRIENSHPTNKTE
ncbi:MAG: DNA polymerase III subunit epsilon [Acidiferrobacterales bacterium]|nr:DNA polymerase III subunit epsilon [Acidiferrobacterales bacterium]